MNTTAETACRNKTQFKALTQAAFRLSNLLTAERDRLVADLGLTSARWQVLETVGVHPTPVTAAEIGRQLQISRQAVQRVLNDLTKQGLTRLAADENDKRAQLASITPAGVDLLLKLDERSEILQLAISAEHGPLIAGFLQSANGKIDPAPAADTAVRLATTPTGAAVPFWSTRPISKTIASRTRTFEAVRDHILHEIQSGRLQSGDRLPAERELASELGVGRSAVREALRSLEMSGMLSFKRGVGGGAFVRESGSEGIETSIRSMLILGRLPLNDLLDVRASLLGQCARLGAHRGTKQDFVRMDRSIDELERCVRTFKDRVAAIEPATEFYRLAARSTHNPLMIMLVDAIADLVAEMLTELKHRPRLDSITARREMVAAMRDGRADDAARVIRDHSYDTNRLLLRWKRPLAHRG